MARQLRPRTKRPSYATLAGFEFESSDNEMSSPVRVEVIDDNESDFTTSADGGMSEDDVQVDELDAEEDAEEEVEEERETSIDKEATPPPTRKRRSAKKVANTEPVPTRKFTTPNIKSKHRATPLFSPRDSAERLLRPTGLFTSPEVATTNSSTHSQKVYDRVSKALGSNVGPGPLWELVEDRSWFKEAHQMEIDARDEAVLRPRVYEDILVRNNWAVLEESESAPYIPSNKASVSEESEVLRCYFGPFSSQQRQDFPKLKAIPPSATGSNGHVINAGAPVWALDWCPLYVGDRIDRDFTQYLAVAPFPSFDHAPDIGKKAVKPSPACIQIWSLSSLDSSLEQSGTLHADKGQMKCELVLCIDSGPAFDLKWCPLPSHDLVKSETKVKKLGLLGGTFEDGAFYVYVVPDPSYLRIDGDSPIYVTLDRPILRVELEETSCWSFDWANSDRIAIGTTNGTVAIYNIAAALNAAGPENSQVFSELLPSHYITTHQSAIRSLAWIKVPPCDPTGRPCLDQDPTMIISGGYDGLECLLDAREGRGVTMNRTRDVITSVTYSSFVGGPISIDRDNMVKDYSISPVLLGRGHVLYELQGTAWSVHASDHHPQLAISAADGSCLTTNMYRSQRRVAVPSFVHRIYQMDYNRQTREYRMLDRFLPQEASERPSTAKAANSKQKATSLKSSVASTSSSAWPQQVGVHCVVWNSGNGLNASGLLASGTASGLCRIDNLEGRWARGYIPYGSIQGVRLESTSGIDDDAMDVDGEDEENGIDDAEGDFEEEGG
ncbi:hypothetical protein CPB83DRAFT_806345 [Crepidotus variabilis]|uniref:Uncharacterized protein n=1 Tax=Crepidotus variabilis TaxID=179855 RepID=A0A9P6EP27_9AGAR|nr:hypothetical protein CPB83DRAFT_806345 [Crepidotus variabilis]